MTKYRLATYLKPQYVHPHLDYPLIPHSLLAVKKSPRFEEISFVTIFLVPKNPGQPNVVDEQ